MKEKFLKRAIELATINSADGTNGPFGAVVVKDNAIIAEGWNRVVQNHDPSAHAEVVAIREACATLGTHVLTGCEIYSSCEPCPMCLSTIYWARIDKLYFACSAADAATAGFDDSVIYEQVALNWQERSLPTEQLQRDDGYTVFQKWIANNDKMKY